MSGGQTGADRAALDAALALGIPHGGWVPRGRWAEDGPLPRRYQMQETDSDDVAIRTEWNVRDSDATLIFSHGRLSGGSRLTRYLCKAYGKPVLHVDLQKHGEKAAVLKVADWLCKVRPAVVNVAGPRASSDPLVYEKVYRVLLEVLAG